MSRHHRVAVGIPGELTRRHSSGVNPWVEPYRLRYQRVEHTLIPRQEFLLGVSWLLQGILPNEQSKLRSGIIVLDITDWTNTSDGDRAVLL